MSKVTKLCSLFVIYKSMEHLYKYIQGKSHQFLKDIGNCKISVSLKVDGTPLQVVFDESHKPEFHSKGSSMSKPGPKLTSVDLMMNPAFWNQVEYLKHKLNSSNGILDHTSIVNLEIIVENTHHLVQYSYKPNGNMYFLNAYSSNSGIIDQKFYNEMAKALGVETVPSVSCNNGVMKRLCDFAMQQGDYKATKLDDESWSKQINKIIGSNLIKGNAEGVVITIEDGCQLNGTQIKIDSPGFMSEFADRKSTKMTPEEEKEISSVMDSALTLMKPKENDIKKYSNDPLENLILNFNATIASDKKSLESFASVCNSTDKARHNAVIEAVPEKYKKLANDPDWFTGLQNFVWLFRKQRKGLLKDTTDYVLKMKG